MSLATDRALAVAGPFATGERDEFPVPADKRFTPEWLRSLTERGEPQWYASVRNELGFIGMPVGGIGAGQVYLGGDGRLWHWDVINLPPANEWRASSGPHYAKPAVVKAPFVQGFALETRVGDTTRRVPLDSSGFRTVRFRGEYPIGRVELRDPSVPLEADLEVFSPFCPLDEDRSSLPATIVRCTLRNRGSEPILATLGTWLENAVLLQSGLPGTGERTNRTITTGGTNGVAFSARGNQTPGKEILVADFESGTYEGWTATGTAFGDGPRAIDGIAKYQGPLGQHGAYAVNTHETRHGEDVVKADRHIGTLLSPPFTVERDFLRFRIGGGNHPGQTCVNLLVDGAPVRTATGRDNNRMRLDHFDLGEFRGREARIQIVDGWTGGWGQVGADEFVLTDSPLLSRLDEAADMGTMALLASGGAVEVVADLGPGEPGERIFEAPSTASASAPFGSTLLGGARVPISVPPRGEATATFIVAWHFPRTGWEELPLPAADSLRRAYSRHFPDATAVAGHVAEHLDELTAITRRWRDTWYDSTLPYWLLDRTLANCSTLATTTCLRLTDAAGSLDRFYGWEGTYCCAGTCQHVWQYAQSVGRLFPALERNVRELVDFGLAWHEDGSIDYRAEAHTIVAHDGLCGTILRAWREHTMSPDDAFLRRIWPRAKTSIEFLLAEDKDQDGLLEGAQYNTLDATWYGPMAWISSLYLAALRAGEAMATEMGDEAFAKRCAEVIDRGQKAMVKSLFNGEWFVHRQDPEHPEANGTNDGCHIDQVFGQATAWQVGLPRAVPEAECVSALKSLYRYSFTPDIGPYRAAFDKTLPGGRWYAMAGEGGLLMCTWPPHKSQGGAAKARGKGNEAWAAGYFVECMSGFEHQVAAHMIWEGLVTEGLAVERMIHDRYHAAKRNPWNEVECSDHYSRAMASHGVFTAACGFEHHGPRGHLGFAPRISPERFKAACVLAQGWGTFEQTITADSLRASLMLRHGTARLRTVALEVPPARSAASVTCTAGGQPLVATITQEGRRVTMTLKDQLILPTDARLDVTVRLA